MNFSLGVKLRAFLLPPPRCKMCWAYTPYKTGIKCIENALILQSEVFLLNIPADCGFSFLGF